MARNKLEAFMEDVVIAKVADVAAAKGITFDQALEAMINYATDAVNPPAPAPAPADEPTL
jgi:hypothetical protein